MLDFVVLNNLQIKTYDESEFDHDNFISNANPNGFGNKVDTLIFEALDEIIFQF